MALKIGPLRLLLLLLAVAFAVLLHWAVPTPFAALDARLTDFGWRYLARDDPEERLVLIDIDERSLDEYGPWPWPRERLAALATQLGAAGVVAQGWDIVLDVPRAGDETLAAALAAGRATLAIAFAFPGQGEPIERGSLPAASPLACDDAWPRAHGQRALAAALAALPAGHINPRVDADGLVRAVPAYVCRDGRAYPALPLALYLRLAHENAPRLVAGRLVGQALPAPIPLGEGGVLHVPYRWQPQAFTAISAADVLAGRAPPERLQGRIALVGATALTVADAVATPFGGAQSGLLVHAALLAGLLDGALPQPAPAPLGAAVLLVGLVALYGLAWRRPAAWTLPLAGLLAALACWALAPVLLASRGWLWAPSLPALALALAGLLLGAAETERLAREAARLSAVLARFLPAPFAARLLAASQQAPQAERREASVLYADLRNFTAWSEAQPPEAVAELLARFYALAVDVVESHGGVVEALEGDAVLAVWNGFADCPDHAARALAAAEALQAQSEAVLPQATLTAAPAPLALDIGLDAGVLLIGAIGPARRQHHLALGLPVTRAMRLAALGSELAAHILLGPGLVAHLAPAERARLVSLGRFLPEGLLTPCEIHRLRQPPLAAPDAA